MNNLVLVTPPVNEPLTLSEVKDYLKISDFESCEGVSSELCIDVDDRDVGIVTGDSIDILGYTATIDVNLGAFGAGALLNLTLQESNDEIAWTDYYDFDEISTGSDNVLYKYTGDCRYIRIVATLTVNTALYGVNVLLDLGYTTEDVYLQSLIKLARQYCEDHQCRAFITQTWDMYLDDFPNLYDSNVISIPKGKLQSIDTVQYTDSDDNVTTLIEGTDFVVSTVGLLGAIAPTYSKVNWDTFTPYPLNPIKIRFTCGYGDNGSDVPENVKLAMKLLISHWFENRVVIDKLLSNLKEIEFTVTNLLNDDRLWTI